MESKMMSENKLPTIGFIGTGAITSALVTGLCGRAPQNPYPIVVSPEYADKAAALKKKYPDRVMVAQSLQEVADRSDWLVLAVWPESGEEVCRGIRFKPEHKVINLLTDKTLPQVRSWIGETAVLLHMVPMTFNAFCDGPIVLCPPQEEASEIFGNIGKIIQVEERYHAAVFATITACATSFFSILDALIEWARSEGVDGEAATKYISGFFHSVCEQAIQLDEKGVHVMATESTPGGINLLVKDIISEQGGFEMWARAMEPVIARLTANIPQPAKK